MEKIKTVCKRKRTSDRRRYSDLRALDSADVWSHPELFQLDEENLTPLKVSGVPPDAFSEDGQLWGNPLYDWEKGTNDFAWWRSPDESAPRSSTMRCGSIHFIGVVQYYAIPYGA